MPLSDIQKEYIVTQSGFDPSSYTSNDDGTMIVPKIQVSKAQPSISQKVTPQVGTLTTLPQLGDKPLTTVGKTLAESALPAVASGVGMAGGAEVGGTIGALGGPFDPITIPLGALLGALVGGGVFGGGTKAIQDELLPDTWIQNIQESQATNPKSAVAGQLLSIPLSGFSPSPSNLIRAGGTLGRVVTGMSPEANELQNLLNVGMGAGLAPAQQVSESLITGKDIPSVTDLLKSAAMGAVFNKPNSLGKLYGLHEAQPIKSEPGIEDLQQPVKQLTNLPQTQQSTAEQIANEIAQQLTAQRTGGISQPADQPLGAQPKEIKINEETGERSIVWRNKTYRLTPEGLNALYTDSGGRQGEPLDSNKRVLRAPESTDVGEKELGDIEGEGGIQLGRPEPKEEVAQPTIGDLLEQQKQAKKNAATQAEEKKQSALDQPAPFNIGDSVVNRQGDVGVVQEVIPPKGINGPLYKVAFKNGVTKNFDPRWLTKAGQKMSEESGLSEERQLPKTPLEQQTVSQIKGGNLPYSPKASWWQYFKNLGVLRNVDLQADENIGNVAGTSWLRSGINKTLAKINPLKAGPETAGHEIFHPFINDLINSPRTARDKAVAQRGLDIVSKSPEYQKWAAERVKAGVDSSPEEYLTTNVGYNIMRRALNLESESPLKKWVKDTQAYLKTRWSKHATEEDYNRILTYKLYHDPAFSKVFGGDNSGLDINPNVTLVNQEESEFNKFDEDYTNLTRALGKGPIGDLKTKKLSTREQIQNFNALNEYLSHSSEKFPERDVIVNKLNKLYNDWDALLKSKNIYAYYPKIGEPFNNLNAHTLAEKVRNTDSEKFYPKEIEADNRIRKILGNEVVNKYVNEAKLLEAEKSLLNKTRREQAMVNLNNAEKRTNITKNSEQSDLYDDTAIRQGTPAHNIISQIHNSIVTDDDALNDRIMSRFAAPETVIDESNIVPHDFAYKKRLQLNQNWENVLDFAKKYNETMLDKSKTENEKEFSGQTLIQSYTHYIDSIRNFLADYPEYGLNAAYRIFERYYANNSEESDLHNPDIEQSHLAISEEVNLALSKLGKNELSSSDARSTKNALLNAVDWNHYPNIEKTIEHMDPTSIDDWIKIASLVNEIKPRKGGVNKSSKLPEGDTEEDLKAQLDREQNEETPVKPIETTVKKPSTTLSAKKVAEAEQYRQERLQRLESRVEADRPNKEALDKEIEFENEHPMSMKNRPLLYKNREAEQKPTWEEWEPIRKLVDAVHDTTEPVKTQHAIGNKFDEVREELNQLLKLREVAPDREDLRNEELKAHRILNALRVLNLKLAKKFPSLRRQVLTMPEVTRRSEESGLPVFHSRLDEILNTKHPHAPLGWSSFPLTRPQLEQARKEVPAGNDHVMDALQNWYKDKDEIYGKGMAPILQAAKGLSKGDISKVHKILVMESRDKQDYSAKYLNTKQLKLHDAVRESLLQKQQDQIADKQPVTDYKQNGKSFQREAQIDPWYFPNKISPKIAEQLTENPTGIAGIKKDFIDHNVKMGVSPEAAETKWNTILKAYDKGSSNQTRFNADREAQGVGLPDSMMKDDLIGNLSNYFNRVSADRAWFKNIESNPDIASRLGIEKDAWGADIPKAEHPINGVKPVKEMIESMRGEGFNEGERKLKAFNKIATAFMLGPLTNVHIAGSSMFSALKDATPHEAFVSATYALTHMGKSLEHAIENGYERQNFKTVSDIFDIHNTGLERMQALGSAIGNLSGRDFTNKWTKSYLQGFGESLIRMRNIAANNGDKAAINLMQHLDPSWEIGKQYSEDGLNKLASQWAGIVHGAHDARTLPGWMLRDTAIQPFFSLASWNIAQTNAWMRHVWTPAKQGNFTPLIMSTLGSIAGGYVIKEMREKLSDKKGAIPSLTEIVNSERGLEGNIPNVAYNLMAMQSYVGYAGALSVAAKAVFDVFHKNIPQGAAFPLDEVMGNTAHRMTQFASAAFNDPNFDWMQSGVKLISDLTRENFQLGRIATAWATNFGLTTDQLKYSKDLSEKTNALRRWEMVEGKPYAEQTPIESNPYTYGKMKEFKRTEDIGEAGQLLPSLLDAAIKKADGNIDVLRSEFKKIKQNSYQTMPNPDEYPRSFYSYLNFVSKTQGPEKAAALVQDYMMRRTINQAKGSMVPSL